MGCHGVSYLLSIGGRLLAIEAMFIGQVWNSGSPFHGVGFLSLLLLSAGVPVCRLALSDFGLMMENVARRRGT